MMAILRHPGVREGRAAARPASCNSIHPLELDHRGAQSSLMTLQPARSSIIL